MTDVAQQQQRSLSGHRKQRTLKIKKNTRRLKLQNNRQKIISKETPVPDNADLKSEIGLENQALSDIASSVGTKWWVPVTDWEKSQFFQWVLDG